MLTEVVNFGATLALASLLLALSVIKYGPDTLRELPEHGPGVEFVVKSDLHKIVSMIAALLFAFGLTERGFLSCVRRISGEERPINIRTWVSRALSVVYLWAVLWNVLHIWGSHNPQVSGSFKDKFPDEMLYHLTTRVRLTNPAVTYIDPIVTPANATVDCTVGSPVTVVTCQCDHLASLSLRLTTYIDPIVTPADPTVDCTVGSPVVTCDHLGSLSPRFRQTWDMGHCC
ncbi:hypothetical protein DFH08DRAFT_196029 [Mycena albidolilacea]|uniref:Uncharacterized protein n=1 Tax=Mycena albidolilacea TaxID=1033008 RepID=A0AAD6ZZJ2_9AGAR|nr:hypothetical protein DFH08DRAFT_196029 [Mycena albidolilacea]